MKVAVVLAAPRAIVFNKRYPNLDNGLPFLVAASTAGHETGRKSTTLSCKRSPVGPLTHVFTSPPDIPDLPQKSEGERAGVVVSSARIAAPVLAIASTASVDDRKFEYGFPTIRYEKNPASSVSDLYSHDKEFAFRGAKAR